MRWRLLFLVLAALGLGLALGEALYRSATVRDFAGQLAGRGRLVAVANEKGIYETDLGVSDATTEEFIFAENLRRSAANENVELAAIDHEMALVGAQFGDLKTFENALASDGLSLSALREKVADHLRGRSWIEKQVPQASAVTETECRRHYETHPGLFAQPVRYRVSHLLLAAHEETLPEIVEEKELAIAVLSARLKKREALEVLAAEASEDEATKARGGDLGFFADTRMPQDFMAEVKKLRPGETSKPFRTHLGFHIARITEVRNARPLTLEEARPEISLALSNQRRANFAHQIAAKLSAAD